MSPKGKAKVGLVFTVMDPSERTWPYVGYDYSSRVNELSLKIKNAFPDVNFDEVTISAGGGKRP
ncbi:MAG: hypothetical protein ACP5T2_05735, partial [Thermoprotei archaeon]